MLERSASVREGGPSYTVLYINHSAGLLKVTVCSANVSNNIPVASMKWTNPGDWLSPVMSRGQRQIWMRKWSTWEAFSHLSTCCDGDCNELGGKSLKRWRGPVSNPLVNLMMSPWVTSNMIHDLRRKSWLCLLSGGSVTVSMETDLTWEPQPFKLYNWDQH